MHAYAEVGPSSTAYSTVLTATSPLFINAVSYMNYMSLAVHCPLR